MEIRARLLLLLPSVMALTACDGGVWARGTVRDAAGMAVLDADVRLEWKGHAFRKPSKQGGCFSLGGVVAPGR